MTTIAWDGKTLAADRRNGYHCMSVTKIARLKDGSLVGFAGIDGATCQQAMQWLNKGVQLAEEFPTIRDMLESLKSIKDENNIEYLRIYEDLSISKSSNLGWPEPVEAPFFAIGSGSDYAMGAMAAGATAQQAVEIASRFDKSTGNGVDMLEFCP